MKNEDYYEYLWHFASRRWGRKRSCLWEALTGQAREARPHVPKGNQGPRQGVVCRKCACIWMVRFIKGKTCLTISLKRDSPNTSLLFIILSTPKPTVTQGHSLPCSASSCPRNSALCRGQTGKDGNIKTPMAVTVGLGSYSTSKGMNRNSTEPMLQVHSNKNSTWLSLQDIHQSGYISSSMHLWLKTLRTNQISP